MININDVTVTLELLDDRQLSQPLVRKMLNRMSSSRYIYDFRSPEQFQFTLRLRDNIVQAAYGLYHSRATFTTFYKSRCNPHFWNLTAEGGFELKSGVKPSEAVNDIFVKGALYAFECATGMVVVLYKAVLETLGEATFNRLFADLYLWDWNFDKELGLTWYVPEEYFPGDIRYFDNPQVNPLTPEWQGENVIDLGNGMYYGHGLGIRPAKGFITALNARRKPGAIKSAFLMEEATRPAYRNLAQYARYETFAKRERTEGTVQQNFITVRFGDSLNIH